MAAALAHIEAAVGKKFGDPANPLLAMDNVIVTPHALCWTDECFAGNGAADIRAVLEVLQGREPKGIVNREVVKGAAWRGKLAALEGRANG